MNRRIKRVSKRRKITPCRRRDRVGIARQQRVASSPEGLLLAFDAVGDAGGAGLVVYQGIGSRVVDAMNTIAHSVRQTLSKLSEQ